jgi:hypothetical protein
MDSFEYLSVFLSILLGLAVTHLVVGAVSIIQERARTEVYWVHLVWVANGLAYITQWWWYLNIWDGLESWSMSIFYLLFFYTLLLTTFVSILFPIRGSVTDYRSYFYENFRWFFGIQFLWLCLDVVEVTMKATIGLRSIPEHYFPITMSWLLLVLVAAFVKNPRYHGSVALLVFFYQVAYGALFSFAIG